MTGRYKAYPEYKNSAHKWLGDIPSHWNIWGAKRIFSSVRVAAKDTDEQLAASQKYGVIPQSLMMQLNSAKVMLALKGTDSFRHVDKDNFVISLRSFEGGIEHSAYEGCVSPAYTVLKASQHIYYAFYKCLLKCEPFIAELQSSTDSLRDGKSISFEQFGAIYLPYFDYEEQQKIANFLDHETAKIDTLITKQEKLIELLKEKRQAVISHAVTKGLNPNAPMKDSGVEWLGKVPEHWEISNLKYFASIQGGYAFNSNEFVDSGVQILRIGNVYQNRLALERQPTFVNDTLYNQLPDFRVTKGDILMSLTGTLGKRDYGFAVKVDLDGHYLLNQRVAKITPTSQKIIPSFLLNVLWSESYLTQLYALPSGTKQANLSNSDVLRNIVAVPPSKEEQQEIALYVEEKLTKLDDLTKLATEAILLMKERKTALISAAVTGKIDVRDWEGDH
ncbi:restriction endonuclease subunit S [Vibrio vulnificus]|nr:restriction endonuclease subunit S [Vibrio vulnificus]